MKYHRVYFVVDQNMFLQWFFTTFYLYVALMYIQFYVALIQFSLYMIFILCGTGGIFVTNIN